MAIAFAFIVSAVTMMASDVETASGQARPVIVDVAVANVDPQPGDDVAVAIEVGGCPAGDVVAQILRETDDGEFLETALMGQIEGTSAADRSATLETTLTDAYRGWYGIRIVCGEYRGALRAVPGSYFQIGMNDRITASISATTVKSSKSLTLSGSECRGKSVEYDLTRMAVLAPVFEPEGSIAVQADGTWSAKVPYPADLGTGRTDLNARCVMVNERGEAFYDYYDKPDQVIVTR